jgi:hypothetical protein
MRCHQKRTLDDATSEVTGQKSAEAIIAKSFSEKRGYSEGLP